MFGRGDFSESYYEHGCTVVPEKDVLETDIPSNTRMNKFKRWWFDLFLLSYADKRAKIYYNSLYAIKMERTRHYRRHRNVIHPLSKFRSSWDLIILLAMVTTNVLSTHATNVTLGQFPCCVYAFGVLLEFLALFDIFINARCGYIHKVSGKIVLDSRKSLVKYCSTKLFFHVASTIPVLSLMFLRLGGDINCLKCKINKFVCTLSFINVLKLFRIFEVSSYLTRERHTFGATRMCRFLRLCLLAVLSTLQYSTIKNADMILRMITTGETDKETKRYLYLYLIFVDPEPVSNAQLFAYTIFTIIYILLYFHYGFDMRRQHLDKTSPLFLYVTTSCFYMCCLIELFGWVNCHRFVDDQILYHKDATTNMARCRQLPDKLAFKLRSYYDFNMTKRRMVEKRNGLFKSLPRIIKTEIVTNMHIRKVLRIPYFSEWPLRIIENLIVLLKEDIYLKNDVVAEYGEPGNGLVIIDAGVMAVYTPNRVETGHLIDGDYFGEVSLVTDKERLSSSVVAVTNCKVVTLEKSLFRKFMREYSQLFFEMKKNIRETYLSKKGSPTIQEITS